MDNKLTNGPEISKLPNFSGDDLQCESLTCTLIESLIPQEYKHFKCYDFLKELSIKNPEFLKVLSSGLQKGKVKGINKKLFDILSMYQPIFNGNHTCIEYLQNGGNIGGCRTTAQFVCYSLKDAKIVSGYNKYLIGSKNSTNGEHHRIEGDNSIIDTTFMLEIDKSLLGDFGYSWENQFAQNPFNNGVYKERARRVTNGINVKFKDISNF